MKIVDDKSELQIGKLYYVRCAQIQLETDKIISVPILGEKHTDIKFGIYFFHYHLDGRFIGDDIHSRYAVDDLGRTNTIIDVTGDNLHVFKGIEIKRKKCVRLTTGINPPPPGSRNYKGKNTTKKYYQWYESMVGKSCKGKICPHRGTTMQEINGQLVCPLHNLRGSVESEVIIK